MQITDNFVTFTTKKQSDGHHWLLTSHQAAKPFSYLNREYTYHAQGLTVTLEPDSLNGLTSSVTAPAADACDVCRTLRMPRFMFSAQVCSLLAGQSFRTFPS